MNNNNNSNNNNNNNNNNKCLKDYIKIANLVGSLFGFNGLSTFVG